MVVPDRLVPEVEFSSGRGVVANFGDTDHTLPDDTLVRRRVSMGFRATPAGRAYAAPPCPNVFAD